MASSLLKTLKLRRPPPPIRRTPIPSPSPFFAAFSTTEGIVPPPSSSIPPQSAAAATDRGRERGTLSKLLLFLPGAISFGLGTWQIVRGQEKIEMIEYRRKRLEMDPVSWNSFSSSGDDLSSLEFRKVVCQGVFDESKNIYVGPRSRSISGVTVNGYYVITPLVPTSKDSDSVQLPILVNRGWVPRDWRNQSEKSIRDSEDSSESKRTDAEDKKSSTWWKFWSKNPKTDKPQDHGIQAVKVTGVIRGSENPSIFVPENDPHSGQWFYVDVATIARTCGLPEDTIYIEDINEDINARNPYPLPKDINTLIRHSVMPQDHHNYTFTWYTLSAAVTFMAIKRVRTYKGRR